MTYYLTYVRECSDCGDRYEERGTTETEQVDTKRLTTSFCGVCGSHRVFWHIFRITGEIDRVSG